MAYNTNQAAKFAKCSRATIGRLIRTGKLTGSKKGRALFCTNTKDEIIAIVEANVPRHGYNRKSKAKVSTGLSGILKLASIPSNRLSLLMSINERFSIDELKLINKL